MLIIFLVDYISKAIWWPSFIMSRYLSSFWSCWLNWVLRFILWG